MGNALPALPGYLASSNDTPDPENVFTLIYEPERRQPDDVDLALVNHAPTVDLMSHFNFAIEEPS